MIIVEDNYSISVEEAQNIVASWIDLWIELYGENLKTQPNSNFAAYNKHPN